MKVFATTTVIESPMDEYLAGCVAARGTVSVVTKVGRARAATKASHAFQVGPASLWGDKRPRTRRWTGSFPVSFPKGAEVR